MRHSAHGLQRTQRQVFVLRSPARPISYYSPTAHLDRKPLRRGEQPEDGERAYRYPSPGDYFAFVLQPDLPLVAIRHEILARYMDGAVRISVKPGEEIRMQLVALEDHPLTPR